MRTQRLCKMYYIWLIYNQGCQFHVFVVWIFWTHIMLQLQVISFNAPFLGCCICESGCILTLKRIYVVQFDMLEFMGLELLVRQDSSIYVHHILYMCTSVIVCHINKIRNITHMLSRSKISFIHNNENLFFIHVNHTSLSFYLQRQIYLFKMYMHTLTLCTHPRSHLMYSCTLTLCTHPL